MFKNGIENVSVLKKYILYTFGLFVLFLILPQTASAIGVYCVPTYNPVVLGSDVTWKAFVSGSSGSVSYKWFKDGTGMDGDPEYIQLSGNTSEKTETLSLGSYRRYVEVSDSSGGRDFAPCAVDVVSEPLSAICSPNYNKALSGTEIIWTALPKGGTGTYTYLWTSPTPGELAGNLVSIKKIYNTTGIKEANLKVSSGSTNVNTNCSTEIIDISPFDFQLNGNNFEAFAGNLNLTQQIQVTSSGSPRSVSLNIDSIKSEGGVDVFGSNLVSQINASLNKNTVVPTDSVNMTIQVGASVPAGNYFLKLKGSAPSALGKRYYCLNEFEPNPGNSRFNSNFFVCMDVPNFDASDEYFKGNDYGYQFIKTDETPALSQTQIDNFFNVAAEQACNTFTALTGNNSKREFTCMSSNPPINKELNIKIYVSNYPAPMLLPSSWPLVCNTNKEIKINWTKPNDTVVGYKLSVKSGPVQIATVSISDKNTTSYTYSAPQAGGLYTFSVKAVYPLGVESDSSNERFLFAPYSCGCEVIGNPLYLPLGGEHTWRSFSLNLSRSDLSNNNYNFNWVVSESGSALKNFSTLNHPGFSSQGVKVAQVNVSDKSDSTNSKTISCSKQVANFDYRLSATGCLNVFRGGSSSDKFIYISSIISPPATPSYDPNGQGISLSLSANTTNLPVGLNFSLENVNYRTPAMGESYFPVRMTASDPLRSVPRGTYAVNISATPKTATPTGSNGDETNACINLIDNDFDYSLSSENGDIDILRGTTSFTKRIYSKLDLGSTEEVSLGVYFMTPNTYPSKIKSYNFVCPVGGCNSSSPYSVVLNSDPRNNNVYRDIVFDVNPNIPIGSYNIKIQGGTLSKTPSNDYHTFTLTVLPSSLPDPVISATTASCTGPLDDGKVNVSIEKVAGAVSYDLEVYGPNSATALASSRSITNSDDINPATPNTIDFVLSGLVEDQPYKFKTRAVGLMNIKSQWNQDEARASNCPAVNCPTINLQIRDGVQWKKSTTIFSGESVTLRWTTTNIPHGTGPNLCTASGYSLFSGSENCISVQTPIEKTFGVNSTLNTISPKLQYSYAGSVCPLVSDSVNININQPPFTLSANPVNATLKYIVGAQGEIKTSPITIQISIQDNTFKKTIQLHSSGQNGIVVTDGPTPDKIQVDFEGGATQTRNYSANPTLSYQPPVKLIVSTDPSDPADPGNYIIKIKAVSPEDPSVTVEQIINLKVIKVDPGFSEI